MKTLLTLALLGGVASAHALDFVTTGTLSANDPTYNRTLEAGGALSGAGTAVHYDTYAFTVTATGAYTVELLSTDATTFDTFAFVYSPTLVSATPLVGYVAGDDDYVGAFTVIGGSSPTAFAGSKIASVNLTAGTSYVGVATAFGNSDLGNYRFGIGGGPGNVVTSSVPEPASLAILGVGAVALIRRRRNRR